MCMYGESGWWSGMCIPNSQERNRKRERERERERIYVLSVVSMMTTHDLNIYTSIALNF